MAEHDKRVCLLTGAAGRLGQAFCQRYAERYHIAAVYHDRPLEVPTQDQTLRDPLDPDRPIGHEVFAIRADLTRPDSLPRIVELTLARFGAIDVLIHSAADLRFWGPLLDADRNYDRLRTQMELNALVPIRLTALVAQACWRDRIEHNRGRNRNVISVSSISGINIIPGFNQSMYSASKAAMNYLTCHMGAEFQSIGVRANTLAPTAFPGIVSSEAVADALVLLDQSQDTGRLVILDEHGLRYMI